jgi:tetratricopeptide (TPR) repeat protein
MSDEHKKAIELLRVAYEHQRKGKLDLAFEWYTRSIETFPTAEAYTFRGWTCSFQNKYEDAIEDCKRAIEVDPSFGNPYNDIGAYLIELGRLEEGIPWLEKAIKAERYEPRHFPHYNLSRIYTRIFAYDKAIHHLKKTVAFEPDHEEAWRELRRLSAALN